MSIITVNPTTAGRLEEFEYTDSSAVEKRLEKATLAQRRWGASSMGEREGVIRAVAAQLRSQKERLAQLATLEMGKPITQARAEVEKCAWCCEHYASNASQLLADKEVSTSATQSYVAYRPLGVILAVMPWNFPFWQVFRAAAPALMAGNTMVLKHASNVSRCALEIEEVFKAAGVQTGLFSTLILSNDSVGKLLDDHRIAAATLTGSEGAGAAVASAAGKNLKKTVLELGGSDAYIVLKDADLEKCVPVAITSRFQNNGQSCIAAKRFIVEEPVYQEFTERFSAAAKAQRVDDPGKNETQVGPVAREDLRDALAHQVRKTIDAGAKLLTGGKSLDRPGFFYEPTIVSDALPGMAMFDEETFGPAAAVIRAKDADEAIALANHSNFGLGGTIWTRDVERGAKLAANMESGSVFINGLMASDPRLPFGGVKRSGYGRELGEFGIAEFVNIQTIWIGPEKGDARSQKPGAE